MNVNGEKEFVALRPCGSSSKLGRKNIFWIKGDKYGSGKISRRVLLEARLVTQQRITPTRTPQQRQAEATQLLSTQIAKPIPGDNKLNFVNPKVKIIFEYWNQYGYPYRKHRTTKSKTTTRIISTLLAITKNYEQQQIVSAIDLFARTCVNPSFAYCGMFARRKQRIGFTEFLRLNPKEHQQIKNYKQIRSLQRRFDVEYPVSWLDECLKGPDYIERNYYVFMNPKDEHPEITERVVPVLEAYQRKKLNQNGMEVAVKFAKQIYNFGKLNNIEWDWLLDRIDEGLNRYHKIVLKRLFHITTDIFWSETLEEYLVSYNKHFMYRRAKLVTDRDQLLQ